MNLQIRTATLGSREVAEMVGKQHKELLRDIRTHSEYLGESNFALTDFFIESEYVTDQNKTLPCYQVTKKGCELIAHKMTGAKGTQFTAKYIDKFHAMEEHIAGGRQLNTQKVDRSSEMEARLKNARVREANVLLKIAEKTSIPAYREIMYSHAAKVITGVELLPLPKTEKHYTATDLAKEFGKTPQAVGKAANTHDLKTEEFGEWYQDKSPYSPKMVDAFRYNEAGRRKLSEIFGLGGIHG